MGLDPTTVFTSLAGIFGSGLQGALSPNPYQERHSFAGRPGTDPAQLLSSLSSTLQGVLGGAVDRASQPVDMSHTGVGDVPSFSGGGLPMPIGVGPVRRGLRPVDTASAATSPSATLPTGATTFAPVNFPTMGTPPPPDPETPRGGPVPPHRNVVTGGSMAGGGFDVAGGDDTAMGGGALTPPPGVDPRTFGAVHMLLELGKMGKSA